MFEFEKSIKINVNLPNSLDSMDKVQYMKLEILLQHEMHEQLMLEILVRLHNVPKAVIIQARIIVEMVLLIQLRTMHKLRSEIQFDNSYEIGFYEK